MIYPLPSIHQNKHCFKNKLAMLYPYHHALQGNLHNMPKANGNETLMRSRWMVEGYSERIRYLQTCMLNISVESLAKL